MRQAHFLFEAVMPVLALLIITIDNEIVGCQQGTTDSAVCDMELTGHLLTFHLLNCEHLSERCSHEHIISSSAFPVRTAVA